MWEEIMVQSSKNQSKPENLHYWIRFCALISAVLFGLQSCADTNEPATDAPPPADTVYINGKIITADDAFSIAQGVAIRDGKFVAVGSSADMQQYVGPATEQIDLNDRTVIPGLMDAHSHMDGAGTKDVRAQVINATMVTQAQQIIVDFISQKQIPVGEWVQSSSWHPPSQLQEQRYLTRQEIDAVAPDHPVFLRTVGHFAMANSRALELAGVDRDTPDPLGGKIYRNENGDATGVLEETAMSLVSSLIPPPTYAERVAQNIAAQRVYNTAGITSAIVAGLSEEGIQVYKTVAERGQASVRTGVMWRASGDSPEEFENALRNAKFTNNAGDDWVRIAGIKISIDGGMTLRSAYVRDPYAGEPDNFGTLSVDPDVYKENVALANQHGWRVGTHAVGDAAIDLVLDAYENASNQSSIRGERFTVIHGSLIAPDQVERAARLDVRVDAQNVFMWDKAETVESFMGLARAIRAVPTKLLVETLGLENTAAGTDNEVNILNPFIGLYIMVTRKDPAGKIYGADQAVTREQALRLYTSSGPYYTFEEDIKGTIEPGKLADMVVLSADYLTVPEESIKDITPLQTIVGGKVVYEEAPTQ